jgi:primosomal protein N' (replication factor Y)
MHESISKGIEHYVELMHGGLSRKAAHAIWESHAHSPSPKIIIGTYQSLSLPLHKLGAIIIERESDDAYQLIERPHLDARILATELARAHTARIIAADTMLRVKTYTECEQGYREHYTPPLHKVRSESAIVCIQKKTEERSHVFSHELVEHITDLVSRKKKILILVARKGIASSVWCTDCGTMLRCAQCKSTQRLVKGGDTGDVPTLACMRCGETESSHTTCTNCGSWKLKNYGFTIEMVKKYVETHWSKTTVTSIDTDSHTEYETKKALGHVHETTDAEIVVATAHTLAYGIHFDVTIVISMESFMAAPVYSADESAFRMFLYAKEQTKESLLFQTMLPKDDRMRACIEHGEIATFLKSERALRTTLKLPPEVVHISLSVRGRRAEVIESVRSMLETLKTFRPRPFKELVRVSPTLVEHTTIVRSPTASWPDAQVVAALKTVDPVFNIKVQTD